MNPVKQTLLYNWNFMRVIRLLLGVYIAYQSVVMHDAFSGAIAGLLLFQAVTNTGCCGSQGCSTSYPQNYDSDNTENVAYEEVKTAENNIPLK
jgi:hypothetical protein